MAGLPIHLMSATRPVEYGGFPRGTRAGRVRPPRAWGRGPKAAVTQQRLIPLRPWARCRATAPARPCFAGQPKKSEQERSRHPFLPSPPPLLLLPVLIHHPHPHPHPVRAPHPHKELCALRNVAWLGPGPLRGSPGLLVLRPAPLGGGRLVGEPVREIKWMRLSHRSVISYFILILDLADVAETCVPIDGLAWSGICTHVSCGGLRPWHLWRKPPSAAANGAYSLSS